jgi:hypothetical protein
VSKSLVLDEALWLPLQEKYSEKNLYNLYVPFTHSCGKHIRQKKLKYLVVSGCPVSRAGQQVKIYFKNVEASGQLSYGSDQVFSMFFFRIQDYCIK